VRKEAPLSELPSTSDGFEKALEFMKRVFGFPGFRPGQEEILESVLAGEDALVIMPTGGGKSLCYQVPAFLGSGITLVVSPLIALMKDQVDSLRVLDLPVAAIHSLIGLKEQEEILGQMAGGAFKLVYVSPERLHNRLFQETLRHCRLDRVAVDEAHCISQWGHDFRPDYLRIGQVLNRLGRPQVVALTATATQKVRTDIIEQLALRAPRQFITGFDRRNLFWKVEAVRSETEKVEIIRDRLASVKGGAIVYTGTRKNVDRLVRKLRRDGLRAEGYHAGLDEAERTRVQDGFMSGRINLVVATNAFGMGIDRSDIYAVIHHTFPGTIEAYYQESGRAGRDGSPATCLLLYSPGDRMLQEFFIESRYPPKEDVLSVYDRLRQRPEEVVWLTYREIAELGEKKIAEPAVFSCIKILEDAGVLRRLQRYDNQAELYLHEHPRKLIQALTARAKTKRSLLDTLDRLYREEEVKEGIQFFPQELAEKAGIGPRAMTRILSEMEEDGEVTYIPPFRGRGLRILKRLEPEDLQIDFQDLRTRKAYEMEKLDQVMGYAGARSCRRAFLLRYFGEPVAMDRCSACDICMKAGAKQDEAAAGEADLAVKVLSGIARLKGRFGLAMAVKMLRGSEDNILRSLGLHHLSTYGLLKDRSQRQVMGWIQELITLGCVAQKRVPMGGKVYPVLILTELGREAMAGRKKMRLIPAPVAEKTEEAKPAGANEEDVFRKLRELRAVLARKEGLPAYCIFQDRTLRQMARDLPATPKDMLDVVGVGEITLRKYGKAFLDLLREIKAEADRNRAKQYSYPGASKSPLLPL
jgi:ATP-dependent DNA helicase RecQ